MKSRPGVVFLILGIAFVAVGIAGQRAFLVIGVAFLAIGIAASVRRAK